jgi:hypothetical protein
VYRTLRAEEIARTASRLRARIEERFSGSGLGGVAGELVVIADDMSARAATFARPIVALRVVSLALVGTLLALIAYAVTSPEADAEVLSGGHVSDWLGAVDAGISSVVFLGAAIIFLVTLEGRIKRHKVLSALHELRAMAHIVDMHQLTKDPERILWAEGSDTASSPARTMTPFELGRYLDYCSEMLAVLSKLAALYGQNLDDPVALAGVDQIESLTAGLSRKIWQKLMILERIAEQTGALGAARSEASGSAS